MSALKLTGLISRGKKIIGIGLNYRKHAAEMGSQLPKEPIVFLKPTTAYVTPDSPIKFPPGCEEMHHEVELGVVIGKMGSDIPESKAMDHVGGYVLALDMTDRTRQAKSKSAGQPWSLAKGFDTSCPIGTFISKDKIKDPQNVDLSLKVNGNIRQSGNTGDMIFPVPFLVSYLSRFMTLEEGDLILTGTPEGVGSVQAGDTIEASLGDLASLTMKVAQN